MAVVNKAEDLQTRIYELEKQQRFNEATLKKDNALLKQKIEIMELQTKEAVIRYNF